MNHPSNFYHITLKANLDHRKINRLQHYLKIERLDFIFILAFMRNKKTIFLKGCFKTFRNINIKLFSFHKLRKVEISIIILI